MLPSATPKSLSDDEASRKEFLINMYNQMFNDINRQLTVTWQSISVLASAFAILSLIEKNIVPLDIAVTLLLLVCAWSIAHLHEASYWYNRNLAIISNIERQFLLTSDLKDVSYYFGRHRGVSEAGEVKNTMIEQLKIHYFFSAGLGLAVLMYHLSEIISNLSFANSISLSHSLPYIVTVVSLIYIFIISRSYNLKYKEFLRNSPGIKVDTSSVTYGEGHGV